MQQPTLNINCSNESEIFNFTCKTNNKTFLTLSDPIGIIVFAYGLINFFGCLIATIFILKYRFHQLVKATSVGLTLAAIAGSGSGSVLHFLSLVEASPTRCSISAFAGFYSGMTVNTALIIKSVRIFRVSRASLRGETRILYTSSRAVNSQFFAASFIEVLSIENI